MTHGDNTDEPYALSETANANAQSLSSQTQAYDALGQALALGALTPAELVGIREQEMQAGVILVERQLDCGHLDAAIHIARGLLILHPLHAKLWLLLGWAQLAHQKTQAARIALERAEALDPHNPYPPAYLAEACIIDLAPKDANAAILRCKAKEHTPQDQHILAPYLASLEAALPKEAPSTANKPNTAKPKNKPPGAAKHAPTKLIKTARPMDEDHSHTAVVDRLRGRAASSSASPPIPAPLSFERSAVAARRRALDEDIV